MYTDNIYSNICYGLVFVLSASDVLYAQLVHATYKRVARLTAITGASMPDNRALQCKLLTLCLHLFILLPREKKHLISEAVTALFSALSAYIKTPFMTELKYTVFRKATGA